MLELAESGQQSPPLSASQNPFDACAPQFDRLIAKLGIYGVESDPDFKELCTSHSKSGLLKACHGPQTPPMAQRHWSKASKL